MRHSFLPVQDQKALKKRYRLHATIVALFMLSVVGIVGVGSLAPAYIRVAFEEMTQTASLKSSSIDSENLNAAEMVEELRGDASAARELLEMSSRELSSTLIKDAISARASVRVLSIAISDISTTTATMVIQGIAPTRESLVSFKTRLEGFAAGNKVELPISELAKSKDIPFSLRFTRVLP